VPYLVTLVRAGATVINGHLAGPPVQPVAAQQLGTKASSD
jgi:hypothetical protein